MSRTNTPAASSASASIATRVRSCWRLKAALLVALTALFCVPYAYLAHHASFAAHDLPLLPPDRWAGFDPRWVWVYQSIYLLTGTLPWLATRKAQLANYVI